MSESSWISSSNNGIESVTNRRGRSLPPFVRNRNHGRGRSGSTTNSSKIDNDSEGEVVNARRKEGCETTVFRTSSGSES